MSTFGEWQPIETAPKDMTVILIADDRDVYAAFWDEKSDPEFPWRFLDPDEDMLLNAWMSNKHGPTHWQPLPPPPKDATP